MTPVAESPTRPQRRSEVVRAIVLVLCVGLMATSLVTRRWLVHSSRLEDLRPWDKDVATMDIGLTGLSICQHAGPCHGYRFESDHLKEQLSLRVASLATFAVGIFAALLAVVAAGLVFSGRSRRVPRTALAVALLVTGLAAVVFHGYGTSRENFITAWYGFEFRAGLSFYAMMLGLAGAMVATATLPTKAATTAATSGAR